MRSKRVVITGIGILTSNAIGKEAFSRALFDGVCGIKPVSLFSTSGMDAKTAGQISDFAPETILGPKGLRLFDRTTKLADCAAHLALVDAKLAITEENTRTTGVVLGATFGSIRSISEFDKEALTEGPQYVNPALFSNTVINAPASQVCIRFNIKGFCATISTGFTASLEALNYAAHQIRSGRAHTVLAGGVEELCIQLFLGFYKAGFLAGVGKSPIEVSCPFDKQRSGAVLGEGAAILVLEDLETARSRGAKIYAEILGSGTGFEPHRISEYNKKGNALARAMRMAIAKSNISEASIDYICAGAHATPNGDILEANAIREVFSNAKDTASISSVKSMIGECYSASGALQTAVSLCAIDRQTAPATLHYKEPDPVCALGQVTDKPVKRRITHALINTFGPGGNNASMVISRFLN
ncbi:MAG: beta-ketoacyl-[acyl-carrier-protein] synthase family protein [Candidatus Omnitrophica bacterium]|nr:beta-ketoacyl-[acyl-carrier-protein] synthase family protein [Candidatus Omnitrophota bacterium]